MFIFYLLMILFFCIEGIAQQNSCPTIFDLLDRGYTTNNSVIPVRGNHNEIAVYDDNAFFLKVDQYPPVRSIFLPHHTGCNNNGGGYYFSFNTDGEILPVPYSLNYDIWHTFVTFPILPSESRNSFKFFVKPPNDSLMRVLCDTSSAPDFILNYNGTLRLATYLYNCLSWDTVINSQLTAYPTFMVQLEGPSEIEYTKYASYTANVFGGQGAYRFEWEKLNANGTWTIVKSDTTEIEWAIPGTNPQQYVYIYSDGYKYNTQMLGDSITIRVRVASYAYPDRINDNVPNEIAISNPLTIRCKPVSVILANEINGEYNHGKLILDGNASTPILSNSIVQFSFNTAHTVRTAELPFYFDESGLLNSRFTKWNMNTDHGVLNLNFESNEETLSPLKAHFDKSYPTKIYYNVDGTNVSGGSIELSDPWYYYLQDGTWQQSSAFQAAQPSPLALQTNSPQSYGGVFLEKGREWQPPYYSVRVQPNQVLSFNRGAYTTSHSCRFLNWSAENASATFRYADSTLTPVIFETGNGELKAAYKGTQLTSQALAYRNNGQRKLCRTSDGVLHSVYESMNTVWYESSTDNGNSWVIMNNGQALSDGNAKNPAIAQNGSNVALVFEEDNNGNSDLTLKIFSDPDANHLYSELNSFSKNGVTLYSSDAKPAIAVSSGGKIVVVWQNSEEIPAYSKGINAWGSSVGSDLGLDVFLTGTNSTSCNATVEIRPNSVNEVTYPFHVAWQQGAEADASSAIKFCKLSLQTGQPTTLSIVSNSLSTKSSGSGYTKNLYPSIIVYPDGESRLSWIGKRQGSGEGSLESRVVFRGEITSYFWSFGSNVVNENINQHTGGYMLGWSEAYGSGYQDKYMRNTSFSTYYLLKDELGNNLTGRDVQICNGAELSTIRGTALQTNNSPYYFRRSRSVEQISKSGEEAMYMVREGIINLSGTELYYGFGDIVHGGEPVAFEELPEAGLLGNVDELNVILKSKPFTIQGSAPVYYSVQYGVLDSALAVQQLIGSEGITFTTSLTDAVSGEVLAQTENRTIHSTNVEAYKNIAYEIESNSNLANRSLRLQLGISSTLPGTYTVNTKLSTENVMAKTGNSIKVMGKNNAKITTYALEQNYPNPFNPSTVISYQLPKAGLVTLKVYDMLGKEVQVLVSEFKESGKYTVEFNGAGLASGVYVYRFDCNDYHATKKLTLLK